MPVAGVAAYNGCHLGWSADVGALSMAHGTMSCIAHYNVMPLYQWHGIVMPLTTDEREREMRVTTFTYMASVAIPTGVVRVYVSLHVSVGRWCNICHVQFILL